MFPRPSNDRYNTNFITFTQTGRNVAAKVLPSFPHTQTNTHSLFQAPPNVPLTLPRLWNIFSALNLLGDWSLSHYLTSPLTIISTSSLMWFSLNPLLPQHKTQWLPHHLHTPKADLFAYSTFFPSLDTILYFLPWYSWPEIFPNSHAQSFPCSLPVCTHLSDS